MGKCEDLLTAVPDLFGYLDIVQNSVEKDISFEGRWALFQNLASCLNEQHFKASLVHRL